MTAPGTEAPTEDYRAVLRKVGTVLIVIGLLDIVWMVYSIARWWSYSSFLNIFAVIAGILLVRGSLPTARGVALFSAFFFTCCAGVALLFPIVMRLPPALVWLCLRLYPLATVGFVLFLLAVLTLLAWTYRMLTTPVVLAAMDQQQVDYRHWRYRPSSGFVAGMLLLVLLFGVGGLCFRGTQERVKEQARREVGPGYRLFVSSLSADSTTGGPTVVHAEVIAYNDHEIKRVPVDLKE